MLLQCMARLVFHINSVINIAIIDFLKSIKAVKFTLKLYQYSGIIEVLD